MDKPLDQHLYETYPELYRDRFGSPTQTLMCWGFECGNGWFPLLDSISTLLTNQCRDQSIASANVIQVKEKFGSLRFYFNGGDAFCEGVVDMAESMSEQLCEICGAPGEINRLNGWLACYCPKHLPSGNQLATHHQNPELLYGLGGGWSRLVGALEKLINWDVEKNDMPPVQLSLLQTCDQLKLTFSGGDLKTHGMVALVNHYSRLIDPNSGELLAPMKTTIGQTDND